MHDDTDIPMPRIDIDEVLREKAPRFAKYIPRFVRNWLRRTIHEEALNDILAAGWNRPPQEFIHVAFERMRIAYRIDGLERLDPAERYLFVANHPFGGLDGMMIADALIERFGDARVVVNDLLMHVEPLQPIWLPVNKHGRQTAAYARRYDEAFAGELPILTFPAGLCSRRRGGVVSDTPWRLNFIKRAHASGRKILTEMAIRFCDSPKIVKENGQANSVLSGNIDWVSVSMDTDNDNAPGNEFDFDMTIHFTGPGFNYENQKHINKNLRGLPEADTFFLDARWRKLPELLYPDHDAAWDLTFKEGKWDKVWFTYDEDDDCNRWERVELYQPRDPFKVGKNQGGIDNNGQADPAGDRGEWDEDNSGHGQLYVSPIDGKIHLYGAEWGCWRIDQNARYYQGMGGIYDGYGPKRIETEPTVFPTVKYTDTDNNGFFDLMEFDLDGDKVFEQRLSMKELGLDDRCQVINTASMKYEDFVDLESKVSDAMWKNAEKAVEVAKAKKLNTKWYALMLQPKSIRERYHYGFWLQFYLYNDLKDLAGRTNDKALASVIDKAYLQGKWELIK